MYKISVVSYLNTLPFRYGIAHSGFLDGKCSIETDVPSVCAQKLLNNSVDIGLVPVAIIPQLPHYEIITDYCLGASGNVGSVILASQVPLQQITGIYLDYQSKTSINLVKILSRHFWNISPAWYDGFEGYESLIKGTVAGVIIGDRALNLANKFEYVYDLAAEWHLLTGLPFVFACWVANKKPDTQFVADFNKALKFGVENIDLAILEINENQPDVALTKYLTSNMDYIFDSVKKNSLKNFLLYLNEF